MITAPAPHGQRGRGRAWQHGETEFQRREEFSPPPPGKDNEVGGEAVGTSVLGHWRTRGGHRVPVCHNSREMKNEEEESVSNWQQEQDR